jgi:hypothetical protein
LLSFKDNDASTSFMHLLRAVVHVDGYGRDHSHQSFVTLQHYFNSLYVVVVDVCTEEIASIERSFYTTLVHTS